MWREQWDRTNRWFALFGKTNAGRTHDRPSDHLLDEVYAFFQSCHTLKDWLKNDPATSVVAGSTDDVEKFINSVLELQLGADIANGSKHLRLTGHRQDPETKIGRKHVSLVMVAGVGVGAPPQAPVEPTIAVTYEIAAGDQTYDAYTVAEACMRAWSEYLRRNGLL